MKFVPVSGWALVAMLVAAPPAFAATWTLDKSASKIGFSGSQAGTPFSGRFKTFSATIDFDPAHPETGHALVTIDPASAATGDIQRDDALPQADWFAADKFKQAVFEAKSFAAKGGDAYEAAGTLTIRGISQPLTLPFKLEIAGDTAHATGHVTLVRTKFGVGQGEWASGDMVALDVGVDLDIVAKK